MIVLRDIVKRYKSRTGTHTVLDRVNLAIRPGEKLGVLGKNGAGKSTLVRLISGQEYPNAGSIRRLMSVSWPLAFTGAFQGSLTGLDNLRFIARVYGIDHQAIRGFVEDFAELGDYFREPVKTYSSGMQARLAFALSLAIEFDCYLIDEIITVGDARFHDKCMQALFETRRDRAFVVVSHDMAFIKSQCTRAVVLDQGALACFDNVADAYDHYLHDVLKMAA
jgi:capsular polysaccharide transport system ATP-binding protein